MDTPDRQLRYFIQIADLGSLSRAADTLALSQSALSRQLAALESQLDCALFIRTGRGVELTEAGQRLLDATREHYNSIDAAFDAAKVQDATTTGSIRVATIHTLSNFFASNLLTRFVSQYRHVTLSVMARSSPEVADLVERGKADIGFVYDSAVASLALDSVVLFDDVMCLVTKAGASAPSGPIDLANTNMPLVGFPPQFALRRMLESAGLGPRIVAEANTIDAVLQLASLNIGSCVLPRHISARLIGDYGLIKLPLAQPGLQRRVVAIVRNTVPIPALARNLLDMAVTTHADLG